MTNIQLKRVYDPIEPNDGARILVDRLWPRGFTKEKLHADRWLKDVAPSPSLIKQFHQHNISWQEFKKNYESELDLQPKAVAELLQVINQGMLTLLFASRDRKQNQAIILRDYLLSKISTQ